MVASAVDERALRVVDLIRKDETAIQLVSHLVTMLANREREKKIAPR